MNELIRKSLQAIVGTIVLAAAVVWLSGGCGERIAPEKQPASNATLAPTAQVLSVEAERAAVFESVSGTIYSARHATISSKILARIEAISVRAGDEVDAGAWLVRLDRRDLDAQLRAVREAVSSASAALDLAEAQHTRIAGLFESKVASKRQLDQALAAEQMAAAELERAQQLVADAEVGASHAEIRSPVAGRIIDRLAEPGDTAAPGAPLLRIYDPGTMRLEAPVRETLAIRLVPDQPLSVRVESLGLTLEGWIDEIVPAAEPGSRTFLVKVRLPRDPRLFSGMFGRVEIPAGEQRRLRIATAAVERIGQLEYVTVVDGNDVTMRRLVTTGAPIDVDHVEVLSGLAAGERVALE